MAANTIILILVVFFALPVVLFAYVKGVADGRRVQRLMDLRERKAEIQNVRGFLKTLQVAFAPVSRNVKGDDTHPD